MQTVNEILRQIRAEIRAEHFIPCPHCGHELDMTDSDVYERHTTYWGDGEPVERTCEGCERPFVVTEHVTRTWTAAKVDDAALAMDRGEGADNA